MTLLVTKTGQSWKQLYIGVAIVICNVLVLVIGINLVLAIAYMIKDQSKKPDAGHQHNPEILFNPDGSPVNNGKRSEYQLDWFDFTAYESNKPGEVAQLLDESYEMEKLGFIYQPWVEFSEPPFRGRHITVGCCRFQRHRVRCMKETGGGSWSDGSSRESSKLRRSS
jgi:hypothetical protein